MGKKRNSEAISPIQRQESKVGRSNFSTDLTNIKNTIGEIDKQIGEICAKENPDNRDMIKMLSLTSQRDNLRNQYLVVPEVVANILDEKLSELMSPGGELRNAIDFEISQKLKDNAGRLEAIEKDIDVIKKERPTAQTPRKWNLFMRNERIRCIQDTSRGIVIFDVPLLEDETGDENDKRLEDVIREVIGEEEACSWKRKNGRTSLRNWKKSSPPVILVRLFSSQSREKVMKATRVAGKKNVKREIPEILADEFKELIKVAAELREKESCQTYVGCGGAEVFLRQRKDANSPWKTIKRL